MILGLTKKIIVIDAETCSPVDLKKCGSGKYWENPSTRTLMVGLETDENSEVLLWEPHKAKLPDLERLANLPKEEVMFAAYNAQFDRQALKRAGIDTRIDKWLDIMLLAYSLCFSGGLDDVLKQFEVGCKKNPEGKRLISLFSKAMKPWYQYPSDWGTFKKYCKEDVKVERALLNKCLSWLDKPCFHDQIKSVFEQWCRDVKINETGMPISATLVKGAIRIKNLETSKLIEEQKDLTNLDNPNSVSQLRSWGNSCGAKLPNLQASTIRDAIDTKQLPHEVERVLRMRLEVGKASVKKFDSLNRMAVNGRLHNCYTTLGASRSGRAASRGLNVSNLERPKLDKTGQKLAATLLEQGEIDNIRLLFKEPVMTVLGSSIRSAIKAPLGYGIVSVDLKSIESVGLAWLAGCDTILDLFWEGKDTYKAFAVEYFNVEYEEVTAKQRSFSKPAVLGCGYRASGRALIDYAKAQYGVELTEDDASSLVTTFRNTYVEIPAFWTNLENAARNAILNPFTNFFVYPIAKYDNYGHHTYKATPKITYYYDKVFLYCGLPSGRTIFYYKPKIQSVKIRDEYWIPNAITYWGKKHDDGGKWELISTHGGMLAGNVTQATMRDVLYAGIKKIDEQLGSIVSIIGHTYDEIIGLARLADGELAFNRMKSLITSKPAWLDDRFYLACDGYFNEIWYTK